MTLYVDDITMSGNKANRQMMFEVRGKLKKRGLSSKKEKENFYDLGYPGKVTGSIISNNRLLLPMRCYC